MKTLVIISSQAFSLINFRGFLIRDLVSENILVYALAPDFTDEFRKQIVNMGAVPVDFTLTRTGINPWRDLLDMLNLTMILYRLRPDTTLGYFIKPVIFGTLAAWIARVPHRIAMIEGLGYVFTQSRNTLSWKRKFLRSMVSCLYRVALSRAHRVIFLNKDDITEFVGSHLVDAAKVVHLDGIGVDLDEWSAMPIVTKPVTFILIARLLLEKGIREYVDAARRVKVFNPEIRFILLGGLDSNPGGLSQLEVQKWVDAGLVEWPGHVEVKPWLAQTSVFVLPSYREGLPRSTQEAMAMGRPVITTDVPGCRETVTDGVNGYLVPVRDTVALTDAMFKFIRNPDIIVSMGHASRQMAKARFDVNKINSRMLEIMDFE